MSKRRHKEENESKSKKVKFGSQSSADYESDGDSVTSDATTVCQDSEIGSLIEKSSRAISRVFNDNKPLAGIILRVSLCNFMCHNRLEVQFSSNVTFVIGRNGSGKSAIMTGIVVGLGGKAQTTNRGGSIKEFVKKGKRTAWVEICLNNEGKDAYEPEVYGTKIVVRRKFSVDGNNKYTICNDSAKVIAEKKEDLVRITDHFNIQVDNPVAILNQDMSRNFLNTKNACDKFKFFMKATQLEQISADYMQINQQKDHTEKIVQMKEQSIRILTLELKALESECKSMKKISDLKEKVKSLRNQLAWAIVAEKERELHECEVRVSAQENSLPRYVDKASDTKGLYEKLADELKTDKEMLTGFAKEVKDQEPLLNERKKEMRVAKDKAADFQVKVRTNEREMRSTVQDRDRCQERIEELRTTASTDFEAERMAREEKVKELELKLGEQGNKQRVAEHELEQYRSTITKLKSEVRSLETDIHSKQVLLERTTTTLNTLSSARNDRLRRFGPKVPNIIQEINERRNQFHKRPRGPLGACFELSDHKWALPVECCVKNLMVSYVVHDHHDEALLENIFSRHLQGANRRPTIITSYFVDRVHDVNQYRVKDSCYPCVLDVIKSDDPVVVNTLIDQRGIENVILIENTDEARHIMMRRRPINAKECFTSTGDQMFGLPMFREYSSETTGVRYLMADVEDQIKTLQREKAELESLEADLYEKITQLQNEIRKNEQELRKCQTQLNKVAETINRLKFDIRELQNVEDPDPADVTTLEEEVRCCIQKIEELKRERIEKDGDLQAAVAAFEEAKKRYTEVDDKKREISDNGISLNEKICDTQHKMDKAKEVMKHYEDKLKEQEKRIQTLKQQLRKQEQECESGRAKAFEICERIVTERTRNSIDSEITQVEKRIQEHEQQHGSVDEVTGSYSRKKDQLKKIRRDYGNLKVFVQKLKEVMTKRKEAYKIMQKHIAKRTKDHFLNLMYHRSFTGKMDFNFEKQILEISVTPSQNTQDSSSVVVKDLKGLSGGERSFSTVCFILSLWEAMESPFRCVDEFDVFMDMVNRRISMDMMMDTADMHKDQQFIILTPQDMSVVKEVSNMKIIRLQDPERTASQSTLNFTQNSQEDSSES